MLPSLSYLGLYSMAVWAHLVGDGVLHNEGLLQDGSTQHFRLQNGKVREQVPTVPADYGTGNGISLILYQWYLRYGRNHKVTKIG